MKFSLMILALVFCLLDQTAVYAEPVFINGSGATFPFPIYSKWFSEYKKIDPQVEINYQSIGSGGGIRQFLDKTVDFGASDAPMTDEQMTKSSVPILHIPTVLGAVVITYNLPELKVPLHFSGATLADIFLGKIKKWNDPKIQNLNPGISLPGSEIAVVHRSDGSGTTAIFVDYLLKVSAEWKKNVGAGTAVKWPIGLGGKGNEGVTSLVKQTPGAVGYVELIYANENKLPVALIQNADHELVAASPASVTVAAASVARSIPKDYRISITDAKGKGAYPISAFTYLLVYQKMDLKKGPKLIHFLDWAMEDGQKFAEPLSYAPLPKELIKRVKQSIRGIKAQ